MKSESTIAKTMFVLRNSNMYNKLYKIIAIFAIFTSIVSYIVWKTYLNNLSYELIREANLIDKHLSIIYKEGSILANWMGNKISNGNYKDSQWIHDTLSKLNRTKAIKIQSGISWPSLSWINPDGVIVANQHLGILQNKNISLTTRSYFQNGQLQPWYLHLAHPVNSLVDNQFIIPCGMGITNSAGEFIGYVSFGFEIQKLMTEIFQISTNRIKFMVYDDQGQVYAGSNRKMFNHKTKLADYIKDKTRDFALSKIFFENNGVYIYHQDLSFLPGTISVGYSKRTFYSYVLKNVAIIVSLFFFIVITCMLIIWYTTSMVVHSTNKTVSAKKKFTSEISSHFTNTVLLMLKHCEHMATIINSTSGRAKNKVIESINDIADSVKNLYLLATYNMEVSFHDLNSLLHEALQIKYRDILAKNITISTILSTDLPNILVDEISAKQIITNIIFHIVNGSPDHTNVTITTYSRTEGNKAKVYLEFRNVESKKIEKNFNNVKLVDMSFQFIKKLIEYNKCYIYFDQNNKIIQIIFTTTPEENFIKD